MHVLLFRFIDVKQHFHIFLTNISIVVLETTTKVTRLYSKIENFPINDIKENKDYLLNVFVNLRAFHLKKN